MAISLVITGTSTISQTALPTLINNIAVVATDSADPSPTFAYSWHLLSKPTGSTASLINNTTNSPDLINVDTWGNYRLFCIVQNTDNNAITETDPLKAPSSCFFTVQVQSAEAGLTKPAAGERNWQTQYHAVVSKVEDLTEIINNNLQEDGTFGTSVSDATATAQGVVELATQSEVLAGTSNGGAAPLSIQPSVLVSALNAVSTAQIDAGRELDTALVAALQQTIKFIPLESIYDFSRQVEAGDIPALANDDSIIYNSGTGYFEGIQQPLEAELNA